MESFTKLHLDENHCFLCAEPLTRDNRTDEHVIPRWLQSAYALRDQTLTLLNGTRIPYRQLTIPCCKDCNNGPLSQMESEVEQFLRGQFRYPSAYEEYRLFQWCSKILYGLLHREKALLFDRSDSTAGTIVPRGLLEDLLTFHHFLTSVRRPFIFDGFVPYSVFVVQTQTFENENKNFDYFDFIAAGEEYDPTLALVFSIRLGRFGVICVPTDQGMQKRHFQYIFDDFKNIPLHPLQFMELACKAAYKQTLLTFSPFYHSLAQKGDRTTVTVIPVNGPRGEIWSEWDTAEYAQLFHQILSLRVKNPPDFESFYSGKRCSTWLYDENENPNDMSCVGW